ncbi:MAG: hypothetical protein FJ151_04445, partial [Euryarchaeota archaeon]|nr:hypothetical protein [Euryarchaeota archaeon]
MLLPEPMARILIVGSKGLLEKTVEVLYDLESVHLIDFPPDEEGFTLGSPLPASSDASQKLLRLRAVEKDLGIEDMKRPEPVPLETVMRDVDRSIGALQLEIADLVESRGKIQQRLGELEQHERDLEPLTVLPLDLELYRGYKSLSVFVGTYRTDPEGVLRESLDQFDIHKAEEGRLIAVFVSRTEADEAQRILIQHGFCEVAVPAGSGQPAEIVRKLDEEEALLLESLEEVTEKLGKLKEKHSAFALASDEHLSIIVMKAETPLRTGATARSFILEAWVPSASLEGLRRVFAEKVGEGVFVEVLEEKTRKAEGHEEEEEVPVKADNPRPVSLFEYFV